MATLSELFPERRISRLLDPKPGHRWSAACKAWIPGSAWDNYEDCDMAIDTGANKAYHEAKNVIFAVGQSVWVSGIQFSVVQIVPVSPVTPSGQLILQPVTAKV